MLGKYNYIRKQMRTVKTNTPHIVQYQGSKRILAPKILRYFPLHIGRLIEPFAGMAAITIAVAQQKRAFSYVVNDINQPLIAILTEAIQNPEQLISNYKSLWNSQFDYSGGSVEHYYHVRDLFNEGEQTAENMLYLLARCVKGSVRYGRNGKFNQSPDKRRNGTSPETLADNVRRISAMLKDKVEFHSLDYREILEMTRKGDLVYMDPPYQGVSNVRDCRYVSGIDFLDFVHAVDGLNRKGVDFVISYDGKCGNRTYGEELPDYLECQKIYLNAGLSSQSTLLGKKEMTYEALYLSKNLRQKEIFRPMQMYLFENQAIV